jgi:hypothetical protein
MNKLLPYERSILAAVSASLPEDMRALFDAQLSSINKVQRLLDWNEVEFYSKRWFKVRWPEEALFQDKAEFVLAQGVLNAGALTADVTVWAVGGHLFSIESPVSLKPFQETRNASFTVPNAANDGRQATASLRSAAPESRR